MAEEKKDLEQRVAALEQTVDFLATALKAHMHDQTGKPIIVQHL